MRPDESFVGQPIRSLQHMLRTIAESDSQHPSVVPDGIYGPNTTAAVTYFQRRYGLPVTGVTDLATWEAIVPVYEDARVEVLEAEPLVIVLNPGEVIAEGSENPNIYLVQAILMVLSKFYGSITPPGMSGVMDLATTNSISSFQQLNQLPMTGQLDKKTWKYLALQYPAATVAMTNVDFEDS